jgi:hypothetical protein
VSARDVDNNGVGRLRTLLADNGVVVLREQDIDNSRGAFATQRRVISQ